MKAAKETIIEKILTDLPIASCRGEMTKEEWRGWFEEAFEKGEKYASQSKWVSCAERLPDEHRRYLCMAYIVDCYVEEVCLYDKENKRFLFNRVEVKVSHYQSLPDKPVEK